MAHRSAKGFCARIVPSTRRNLRRGRRRAGVALTRWASQAQACRTRTSAWVTQLLAKCAAPAAPRLASLALENLESRQLLSAVTLSGGTLSLAGDPSSPNSLVVDYGNGYLWANADGHQLAAPASAVQKIQVTGGNAQDWVYINPVIQTPVVGNSYGGNDTIRAGSGPDTITCGDGNDTIYASGSISLGNGDDVVWTGALSSSVQAGDGNDLLVGGPGNDTLVAGNGHDTLIGGAGSNELQGGPNTSFPYAGPQDRVIHGTSAPAPQIPTYAPQPQSTTGTAPQAAGPAAQAPSVTLSNGVLSLVGVASDANGLSVDLSSNGYVWANADGHTLVAASGAIRAIQITGGNAPDFVYINPGISAPATINTFGGNDTIRGGSGYDTINSGDGNDIIYASGSIALGNGNSVVWVGNQSSSVQAGNGDNLLVGGPGNDTLVAGSGHDTLIGGAGANVLQGGANTTFPNAGPQDRIIHGGTTPTPIPTPTPTPVPSPVPAPAPQPQAGNVQWSNGGEDATAYGSNHGDWQAPTPVISVLGANGQAEHSVFVNALSSNLGAGTPLTAKYQWDFGDPGSRFNQLPGWNAGHIYDRPGTYNITLTITNEVGKSSSVTMPVNIAQNFRRTIYVDAWAGSDYNSGLSPSQPIRTADRVNQLVADNTTILFRRGETFDVANGIYVPSHNIVFGAYGSGAAPVMRVVPGPGGGVFSLGGTADQVVIENLTFDSVYLPYGNVADHISATAVYPAGRNITVRNNTFLNVDNAVDAYRGPTGMLLQDNSEPLATGLRGYFEWMNGTDQVIVGNYVANSTREHIMRSSYESTSRFLIAGNNFDKPYRQNVDPGDVIKTTINIRGGSYIYIADNTLSDAMTSIGPDGWSPADWGVDWVVMDGNRMHNSQIYLHSSVHHADVRNNLLDIEGTQQIWLDTSDPIYASRQMADVTVEHNTGTQVGNIGVFLMIDGTNAPGAITVKNNLFAAPNLVPGWNFAATVVIHAWNANAVRLFSHNVWAADAGLNHLYPGGVNFIAPVLDPYQYRTTQQWNWMPNVQDDQFRKVAVNPSGSLQAPIDGQWAGAVLPQPLG